MKVWRVSTNVVGWIKAETEKAAIKKFVERVQESDPDDKTIEAISVEDVYDVTDVTEPEDGRDE